MCYLQSANKSTTKSYVDGRKVQTSIRSVKKGIKTYIVSLGSITRSVVSTVNQIE